MLQVIAQRYESQIRGLQSVQHTHSQTRFMPGLSMGIGIVKCERLFLKMY